MTCPCTGWKHVPPCPKAGKPRCKTAAEGYARPTPRKPTKLIRVEVHVATKDEAALVRAYAKALPAQAPRAQHVEGCRYRQHRSGKPIGPDVQHRPRLTTDEARVVHAAKKAGVNIVDVLTEAIAKHSLA